MNSMERITKLMKGELPDRVPVICNLFEQGADELGISIPEYYERPENVAEGQLRLQRKYGYDCIWGFAHTAVIAQILGCRRVLFSLEGPPNVGHMILRDVREVSSWTPPTNLEDIPAMQDWIKTIEILRREVGGQVPILTSIVGSFTLPTILMGMEKWMELLLVGPRPLRNELLKKCSSFNRRLITALRNAGVDLISYSNPMSSREFLMPDQFERIGLPSVLDDFQGIGVDGIVYFNGGGEINPIINFLLDATGIGGYYLHPDDDIVEAKSVIAGRGLCAGVINDMKLLSWSHEEIVSEVERIMGEGKDGGGFLFGTMAMPYRIPAKNIRSMLDAAYRAGSYTS
ncbi:MAG: uroporphyrinogen decarboxylase family protein [Spirochaetaceae bacterium]|nr:uroporphyrinogen decarboxylase family protein [Spirochaetaceae bacterium]MDT8297045.1 uroporphyrinogen decarboxylase family protein [Spirochaetaceae bacterium]